MDEFTLLLPDLGQLQQLKVRSDGAGAGAAWHLEKVLVYPPAAQTHFTAQTTAAAMAAGSSSSIQGAEHQQFPEQPVYFIAQRWLDQDAGLQVVLPALHSDPGQQLQAYHVQVYTSDVK